MRDWDEFWCEECQETGHPTPGTDEWEEFCAEADAEALRRRLERKRYDEERDRRAFEKFRAVSEPGDTEGEGG